MLSRVPVPIFLVCTTVDWRFTEVYFVAAATLHRLLADDKPVAQPYTYEATLITWLQTARIAFDRSGLLQRVRDSTRQDQWIAPPGERETYAAWFTVNYNLTQTKRMLASEDSVYLMTVDLRLLYCIRELWHYYFRMRRLPAMSEKDQVRYMEAHDAEYRALFFQCLNETNREHKVHLYEQLARRTLAPAGDLWPVGATAIQFAPEADVRPEMNEAALSFWDDLTSG